MIEYDSKVIQEHSQRLYHHAKSAVPMYFFIGLLSGMIIFGGITAALGIGFDFLIISIGVLVGGIMGYGAGQNKAFELRLQAHVALCQCKIEQNTRR